MSQMDEEDPKWTEHDLREAIRRINAGEINFKEAENVYGISPRTIHRQRAIENMRAQLNPEKSKKLKSASNPPLKKDVTVLRKSVDISCHTLSDIVGLLSTATEEVKQFLNYECDLIYECKVCKNLFRSLVNFISHKRNYCCDLYSVIHARSDENDDESEITVEERLKQKENMREFTAKPFRVTCRKDLTTVLKRITTMAELVPAEPILHLQTAENTQSAFQQVLFSNGNEVVMPLKPMDVPDNEPKEKEVVTIAPVSTTVQVEEPKPQLHPQPKPPPPQTEKPQEKSSATIEKHFTAEKRFRCPICMANFTLKRSTLRHLKTVHHKSLEQVEKLKTRIQVHFVKMKNGSNDSTKKDEKYDLNSKIVSWSKECLSCNRYFVNKPAYVTHLKSCRRNISRISSGTNSNTSPQKSVPLVPVVSLTPIAGCFSPKSESGGEDDSEPAPVPEKSSSLRKVSLPLASSSSNSKKIGIQVRMNYCKDSPSAPNSASVTPTSYTTSSGASQSSEDESRRNSILSIIGCTEDLPPKIIEPSKVSHNTRSGSKLAHILENLYDKKTKAIEENAPVPEIDPFKVTYNDNCRKVFPINEISCDLSQQNNRRYPKHGLRDSKFQSDDIDKAIPCVSSNQPALPETELSNTKSNFITVFCDQNSLNNLEDGKKKPVFQDKTTALQKVDSKLKKKLSTAEKQEKPNSTIEPVIFSKKSNEATTNTSHSSSTKRKLPSNASKSNPANSKPNEKDGSKINFENIEDIPIKTDIKEESKVVQRASVDNARTEGSQITVKRIKKVKKDTKTPAVRPKTIKLEPKVLNGDIDSSTVSSSEDEENDKFQKIPIIKPKHTKSIKNQNITSIDQKLWNSPQRMNLNTFQSELSPSSSAPDSDIDQSTMSDENLRKSIMTIIFGKDMTAEKIEQSILVRDKSPKSSSSSECDKDKRYSFRIAQKSTQKAPVAVESREDKALKPSCLNKGKTSSR